jgi:dTDP-glucose pyrophosphorylase
MIVNEKDSLLKVIKKINDSTFYFQLVVKNNKLVGTVSDGDIRRAILFGINLNDKVSKCMNANPIVGNESSSINFKNLIDTIPSTRKFLPVIDKKKNLKYLIVDEEVGYNKSALIMAGGFGKRLGEKTKKVPKPLLKVGTKPMLEIILKKLEKNKFDNIYISTHYLHKKIEKFLENRKSSSKVKLIYENKPLGTAGCIKSFSKIDFNFLTVINGDIVSDIDFNSLGSFHIEKNFDITITVAKYSYEIPFGVVNFASDMSFKSLIEKPIQSKFVLSGIYCLNKEICDLVGRKKIDMPELINQAYNLNKKIGIFPVYEYWRDIGNLADFKLVNKEKG